MSRKFSNVKSFISVVLKITRLVNVQRLLKLSVENN